MKAELYAGRRGVSDKRAAANMPKMTAIATTGAVLCWINVMTNRAEKIGAFMVATNVLPSVAATATASG